MAVLIIHFRHAGGTPGVGDAWWRVDLLFTQHPVDLSRVDNQSLLPVAPLLFVRGGALRRALLHLRQLFRRRRRRTRARLATPQAGRLGPLGTARDRPKPSETTETVCNRRNRPNRLKLSKLAGPLFSFVYLCGDLVTHVGRGGGRLTRFRLASSRL